MRIALVIEQFDPHCGGAERWTWDFATWLRREGYEVHVVARRFAETAAPLGIIAHAVSPLARRLRFAEEAESLLRRLDVDVIHDMGSGWYGDVFQPHGGSRRAASEQNLALAPPLLRPLKRVVQHWLPRYRQFDRLVQRQFADQRRAYIALSQMVARDFSRWHGVPSERVRLIYNGVDTERFTPDARGTFREEQRRKLGSSPEECVVLIVAHNFRLKGVPALLRAVGELRRQGQPVRLVIAGGRPTMRWHLLARRWCDPQGVTFAGPVDDPRPLYAAADVYAQPTHYDPCSLVVLEALACGLPVITTRYNGAGEQIDSTVSGRVLEHPSNHRLLARAIESYLNPAVRARAGEAARSVALAHTFERNCREVVAVYEELQARRRAA